MSLLDNGSVRVCLSILHLLNATLEFARWSHLPAGPSCPTLRQRITGTQWHDSGVGVRQACDAQPELAQAGTRRPWVTAGLPRLHWQAAGALPLREARAQPATGTTPPSAPEVPVTHQGAGTTVPPGRPGRPVPRPAGPSPGRARPRFAAAQGRPRPGPPSPVPIGMSAPDE